jgi:signal transduction histidine kinase
VYPNVSPATLSPSSVAQTTPPPTRDETRRERLVLFAGALLIVLLSAAAAFMLWRSREDQLDTWRRYLQNFSATTAEHATQTVMSADFVLRRIVDRVQAAGVDSDARLAEFAGTRAMFDFIHERAVELPLIDVATIVALDGRILNFSRSFPTPPINLADRDYLQAHLADPSLELYLSQPVQNRGNGRWTFYLARKIHARSGRLIGIALAGLEVDYFERFYRSINLNEGGTTIALFRRDGTLLARHPQRPQSLGKSFRDGAGFRALEEALSQGRPWATALTSQARVTDASDATVRLVAPHLAGRLPMVVTVSATQELMLQQWRRTAWFFGLGALLLDAVVAAMTLSIHRLLHRRRAELQQLDAARTAAESANRVKSQFLANMSHEIRTPLHGMLGTAQLMLAAPLAPAQRQQAEIIVRSGRTLLRLIDDVLDFSRIEAGRLQLERVPFDLACLAEDSLALVQPQALAKGLALQLEIDARPARGPLVGDPLRLAQIVNNLLSNAVKFTPAGTVVLAVVRLDDGRWRIAVRDTGIGLSAAQRESICRPFTQGDSSTTRRFGGSGLGLSIVARLVRLHGGELAVDSEPGRGSEFSFVVDLPPAPAASAAQHAVEPPPATPAPSTMPRRVLVAEDNEVNMLLACAVLRRLGIDTLQAGDGLQALALFERERPDAVLMDVHMPECDGLQASRRMRELEVRCGRARTPIVALTANALPEAREQCLAAGMDDLIVKPFEPQRLSALLQTLCRAGAAAAA